MKRIKRCFSHKPLPESALRYVLESFIPYTDANLKLSFRPNIFFNDLENIERQKQLNKGKVYKRSTLRQAFYRAKREGLIDVSDNQHPKLTTAGQVCLKSYTPSKLGEHAYILVTFDIPEERRSDRNHFRWLLQDLKFEQVQRSVWKSDYDNREILRAEIDIHDLHRFVNIYEAVKIK